MGSTGKNPTSSVPASASSDAQINQALFDMQKWLDDELHAYEDSLNPMYVQSTFYTPPTIKDVLETTGNMRYLYDSVLEALQSGKIENIQKVWNQLDADAKMYGSSWYDEDLEKWRTGYEWETETVVKWMNIIAPIVKKNKVLFDDYWEGVGV